jgi:2-iminobutanoate/2-iminopropanoate deaminase
MRVGGFYVYQRTGESRLLVRMPRQLGPKSPQRLRTTDLRPQALAPPVGRSCGSPDNRSNRDHASRNTEPTVRDQRQPVVRIRAQAISNTEVRVRTHPLLVLLLAVALPLACPAQQPERKHFQSKLAVQRHLPFSSAVLVGNTLYIAGTTGVSPENAGKPLSAEAEARSVMDQIKGLVKQSGMTMDDIVSVQVFCTDLANYDAFNRVYRTYFHGKYPARAFVGVSKLLFGARYEVMGIAVKTRIGLRPAS